MPANSTLLQLLVRILKLGRLQPPQLAPDVSYTLTLDSLPLVGEVLDHRLGAVLCLELADELWVPELRGDAEVLAAAHEGVGFACLGGGGDAGGVEVFLFAAGNGDEAGVSARSLVSVASQAERSGAADSQTS